MVVEKRFLFSVFDMILHVSFSFFVFLFKHFKKELNTLERVKNEYMRKNNEQVLYPFNFLSGYQVTFVETVCR